MVFRLDPCGISCILLTQLLVLYSDYVVVFHLVLPVLKNSLWAIVNTLCFNIVASLLLFSHLCAVLTDPGLIPLHRCTANQLNTVQKPGGWTTCNKCGIHRPPRAHHCRICRRCVRRMDHHCPWINNCVGECNQKYFIQFLIYVGILCVYALTLVIICRAMISVGLKDDTTNADVVVVAHTVVLVAISCLFGLFILAILSDQYKSIVEDTTAVEYWKLRVVPSHSLDTEACPGEGGFQRKLSKLTLFREVFGSGPFYSWLLPCAYLFKPYPKYYTNLSNIIHDVNCSVNTPQVNHNLDNKTTVPVSSVVSSTMATLETDSSSDSSFSHY
ncbi:hypothetical protein MN116_008732 [Schistosoma mekongi]|uniref:Palmitoyltransferase n=1 Tax=Schistosoma mekongi TaxID=38744 RepID=A0AAE1Z5U3_SCHME|nr:hypothetical protein MN116_008732 [Schistosoma mekongi]